MALDAYQLVERDLSVSQQAGHEVIVSDDQALILTYQAALDFVITLRREIARRGLWPS